MALDGREIIVSRDYQRELLMFKHHFNSNREKMPKRIKKKVMCVMCVETKANMGSVLTN